MKRSQVRELAVALSIAVVTVNAWAQTGQMAGAMAGAPNASATAASGALAPVGGKKADRALRRKVYAAIAKQKEISAGDISVIAKDGAITLNGAVTDASQIDKVVGIARSVAGVNSVTSKLTVAKPLGGM